MDSILTMFYIFIAVLTALLMYLVLPYIPLSVLTIGASVALAVGVWWHWKQFSVEYRLSTWQEMLRNYASYALLLLAILLSYGFYVFVWTSNGGNVEAAFNQVKNSVMNAGRLASERASQSLSAVGTALSSNLGPNRNANRNAEILE
jgi:hypothetical protein